ncbi:hypothetical protein [Paenibacillus tepidiphilus]|uniref:hypothetical protein n=1 Tax=Paenibacillus tepidiphilus TaxID=2608683 RepID=UPI0013A5A86D|nr:hypothetical protein [Paenibacillus tepidiphilus]
MRFATVDAHRGAASHQLQEAVWVKRWVRVRPTFTLPAPVTLRVIAADPEALGHLTRSSLHQSQFPSASGVCLS